ncbi:class I SAM-dependent methyltransferase [Mesorhizobium australafricanum]|uniref:Class I SAM-dependent methyltransferase n=1 Tax=Mesorhizobium australafricanum TaxID=3072311 RepID=A0ABU4WUT5_9HYPH|nr:class I SAM-dependent methyltransferase [Mesorhizobium sp. VK3E]MDX8438770.1 class I SAM-dependent methyltransferase [Mesorhizobium sp. VK3E]
MTQLKERIVGLIGATGPIPVSEYMALCLFDPDAGYYTTREPFGAAGDFITAPEVSQMFGELVAIWLYQAWQGAGRPLPVTFAEIGPGRGTLMKDMLRTWSRLDPALVADASFAMIETSRRLVEIQKETLAGRDAKLDWHQTIDTLPRQPLFIVGNELFDAVPIRQFVHVGESWRERMVGLDDNDDLRFFAGAASLDPTLLPEDASDAPEGAIAEMAPARVALMSVIAGHIAAQGGAGLFIDYGHLRPGIGDTLQALRRHRHEDVLANPGEADLTAHVDFAPLADMARAHGLGAQLSTQGEFLLGMGLIERAGTLGADADAKTRRAISDAVERLAGPDAMGELFKVMKVLPAARAA